MGKGLKIGFKDAKGNTALHWASYMAMDHAVEALIAWGA
jgi:ankyrin repeat protein